MSTDHSLSGSDRDWLNERSTYADERGASLPPAGGVGNREITVLRQSPSDVEHWYAVRRVDAVHCVDRPL